VFTVDSLIALVSLTAMEVVLGIDNVVFIAIIVARAPQHLQDKVRSLGIGLALVARLGLLFSIRWVMGLTAPLFSIFGNEISGRDLILILGGLFLLAKSTLEIHNKLEAGYGTQHGSSSGGGKAVGMLLLQIIAIDIVFSLDSVITAVGMTNNLPIMVIAMLLAVGFMLFSSGAISRFVEKHPTIKILALSFLILIGVMLCAEGMGVHIGKGYIYFAMSFSLGVELLNMRFRKRHAPVHLHEPNEN
jgi:predicted tellurium resistance membrane protein TerC